MAKKKSKQIKFTMIQSNQEGCTWIKGFIKEKDIDRALNDLAEEIIEQHKVGIKTVVYFDECSLWSM